MPTVLYLYSHIFAHLHIIRQNFYDFDGMGVVFPLCVSETYHFKQGLRAFYVFPLSLAKGKGYFLSSQT